ncbi:phenylalanine--tRNA ligase subunit beta [Polluticoccus soli]|uniref:phenylalanine--tRNA ligase subunit beta n=1 Tax=Polluticoccus soli TaxID=3034150 RepID=UPI0023E350F0|nr:phenylalanine--tRNA ligase subunit beta [Flavipsychrobacter sp. JY13-12]
MVISYQWLLSYLPKPLPAGELGAILTSIGLEVEAIEPVEAVKGSLAGLVIGEVLTAEKHPNADKLKVTTVNIGGETPLKIVCGAPNVAAGQRVIVAPIGTTVHPTEGESFLIKKAKIRGEESEGMICADDEIGLGMDHAGIKILPEDAPIGTLAATYFNISEPDHAIHIGLTANRSDAMSHIGVAGDVCAYLSHHAGSRHSVQLPEIKLPAKSDNLDINVTIEALEACPRYMGLSLTNVKVGQSPEWLQQRLKTIGVRSINNVVDITNFVLHEYGQPLHAFDAAAVKGNKVIVKFMPEGSKFTTLDEKERTLQGNDLMICNESEGMCIAGVFGGLHSGVTDNTTSIFLESAYFDAKHIRRTSMHHGLRTDAATHFEKGVDINNVEPALKRAAALMVEICGAKIASEVVDVYVNKIQPVTVDVTYEYINKLSGKEYSAATVKNILTELGFTMQNEAEKGFTVQVPTNKTDVTQQADVVEEILRIDGLDNVQIPDRLSMSLARPMANDRRDREKIANMLSASGFNEIVTNSIVNSKFYPEREDLVRMLNSLSSELDVMRPSMLESGLEVLQYNYNRKNQDLALYEFGTVYRQENGKYIEDAQLALWVTGNMQQAAWNAKPARADMFYVKGVIDKMAALSGVNNLSLHYTEGADTRVEWKYKNQVVATATQVPAKKLDNFDIKQDVYFIVVNWAQWLKAAASSKIKYQEVPKFPVVQRDLAIVLDKAVSYQQVQQVTEQLKLQGLLQFGLFDVFESEKLGAGKKSYALSYTFQLQDRTLTDTEIEQLMQQLTNAYKTKLQAQIRE